MIKPDARISLADLSAVGIRLRPMEAVTLVCELIAQVSRGDVPGMPSAHVIRLSPSGDLFVEGPVAAGAGTVSRAAQLLDTLLPGFGASAEHRVPGGLRLAIARGLGLLDVPPYASLEGFAEALNRFGSSDPAAVIKDLASRWAEAAEGSTPVIAPGREPALSPDRSPDPSSSPEASAEAPHVESALAEFARPIRPSEQEPVTALVRADADPGALTISDIRRARRATGLPLSEVSSRSRIPSALLLQLEWGYFRNWPAGLRGRTQLVRYARAAGIDEQIVIQTVLPLLEEAAAERKSVERATESPEWIEIPIAPISDHEEVRPGVDRDPVKMVTRTKQKRTRMLAALAIPAVLVLGLLPMLYERQQRSDQPAIVADAGAEQQAPDLASGPDSPGQQPAAVPGIAPEAMVTPEPQGRAAETAQVDVAADVAQVRRSNEAAEGVEPRPVQDLSPEAVAYSPSFASVGSAMFYHARGEGGSALIRADTDEDGAILRITKVVDDNAQNFHARPSPDGTQIAFDSDRDGERGVYVAKGDGTDVRRVSGEGFAAVPSWSPDGRMLAFVRAEPDRPKVWNLWTVALETGEMRRLTAFRYGQPWGGSWFPDGRRIAYSHEDRLIVLDIDSGRERVYPSPRKGRLVRTPAVSPDGRRVIFQVYRDGAWLLDVPDGSMRKVLADPSAEEYTWSPDGRRVAYHSRQSGEWGVWLMAAR